MGISHPSTYNLQLATVGVSIQKQQMGYEAIEPTESHHCIIQNLFFGYEVIEATKSRFHRYQHLLLATTGKTPRKDPPAVKPPEKAPPASSPVGGWRVCFFFQGRFGRSVGFSFFLF